jgi:predicted dehydrogenase/threonine dehydrogenase-like Zn-dependent dehydrogenase
MVRVIRYASPAFSGFQVVRFLAEIEEHAANAIFAPPYGDAAVTEPSRKSGSGAADALEGYGVVWPELGRTRLEPVDVPACGPGEVTVDVVASAVSPGTERARYLGLPNARIPFPHRPGYAAAGVVIETGDGVTDLVRGDQVALLDVPHQSVATVPAERAYRIPDGVSMGDAAVLQLGIVAAQGVRRAEIQPGAPFAVVGMGLIGALAQRLARAQQAGSSTAIARSASKARFALADGDDRFLSLDRDATAVEGLQMPLVIEATGDPAGVEVAILAAAPGGRVILLGSPRSLDSRLPAEAIYRKGLRVVGAHVNGLRQELGLPHKQSLDREAGTVLGALASGAMVIGDLFAADADPREAERFYWSLIRDRSIVGARFDWTGFPARPSRPRIRVEPARPRPATAAESPFDGAVGRLRFAMIGCGEIAVLDAEALALAPNTSVTACYDADRSLAESLALDHGAWVAPSLDAVLERADVDAIMICLPHHLHEPVAVQAAEAGKHIIVEKPMAVDLEAAARMLAAVDGLGVALSVCFPQRYEQPVATARELLANGAIGALSGLEVRWYADKPASYFYGGFTGRSPSTWRMRQEQAGGGVLLMNLSHEIELVRHLTGARVDEVLAFTANTERLAEVEDNVTVSVRYEGGAIGSFTASASSRGFRDESIRIWGSDGHLEIKPDPRLYTLRAIDGFPTASWTGIGAVGRIPTRAVYVSRFATAVSEGREPDVTALDGVSVQAFLEAAYESARTGASLRPADLLKRTSAPEEAR